jgi:hypothetical protein
MTDIEEKALALVNEVRRERDGASYTEYTRLHRDLEWSEALCRAIEQHEAFKQEVSDVMTYIKALYPTLPRNFDRFIIPKPKPKPDPLAGVLEEVFSVSAVSGRINAALEARGLEIREKGQ